MFRKLKRVPTNYTFNGIIYSESQIPEIFRYTNPDVPEDCTFIISPSQIGTFFSNPKQWYLNNVTKGLNIEVTTSMILGTICHYIYDSVACNRDITREEINEQLDTYLDILANPDIDGDYIKQIYPSITSTVVNTYNIHNNVKHVKTEIKGYAKIAKGIYVAGTSDRLEDDTVIDFKTVRSKPNGNDPIPFYYKVQLLAYWYIFTNMGYNLNKCKLIYGILPTKTMGVRTESHEFTVDYIDIKLINDTLNLIAETILKIQEDPSLAYLLFKSYDLKE